MKYGLSEKSQELEIGKVPLIFVAHSMGGLVIKRALLLGQIDGQYKQLISSARAIVFLSTPHRGTNLAESLNRILAVSVFNHSAKQYIAELRQNSPAFQDINEQFRHIAPNLNVISFYETQKTAVGPKKVMVLEKDSSILGYPNEVSKPLEADHHHVCKFTSQQDPNYISVRNALTSLLRKLTSAVQRPPSPAPHHGRLDIEGYISSVGELPAISDAPEDDYAYQTAIELPELVFDRHARVGRHSSELYDKVAVILISWDGACDDLNTEREVENLARMFRETYNYRVQKVRLEPNGDQLPQVQLNKYIADFVFHEDGPSTLLIVYYAGHGTPGQRHGTLELIGERNPTIEDQDPIIWNYAAAALQQTKGDIFVIFDCCYAGDLGRATGSQIVGARCVEFLGATSSGATTRAPGKQSFTSGLIWALGVLAKEIDIFTAHMLLIKIRAAPGFPQKQVPILYDCSDPAARHIVIAPGRRLR